MRRRGASAAPAQAPPWAILSFLLRYPDEEVMSRRGAIAAAAGGLADEARDPIERFLSESADDQRAAAAAYVETFDLRRRASLNLTYYVHGDTRERGMALVRLKKLYRVGGLPLESPELPDHLAVMLAFAALAPDGYGEALLAEHLPAIELLRLSLHDLGSPYAHLLDAVVAGLPALGVAGRAEVARLAREGPPDEAVGLEPYGPPEAMPEGAHA